MILINWLEARRLVFALFGAAVASWAASSCAESRESSERSPAPPATHGVESIASPLRQAGSSLQVLGPGDVLLDVHDGQWLVGSVLPAPSPGDPPLRMRLSLLGGEATLPHPWGHEEVSAAAFWNGRGLLVVTADGRLLAVMEGGESTEIDRHVDGPIACTPDGRRVAYMRGDMPDFEIFSAYYDGKRWQSPQAESPGLAPAWSPGLSPNGEVVVFVSAAQGTGLPRWWGREPGRALGLWFGEDSGELPFAAGLSPTRVSAAGELLFESEAGAVLLHREGRALAVEPNGRFPWFHAGRPQAILRSEGKAAELRAQSGATGGRP